MSRSWKECHHLAPDVSILKRVLVQVPSCRREGCMSCAVMSTYVIMSMYVSCAGMRRRRYGSCENCVYKEGWLLCFVFFFSSCNLLYSIQNINLVSVSSIFSISSVSSVSSISSVSSVFSIPLSQQRLSSAARPCPTCPSDIICPCLTLPSDAVCLCPTCPCDAVCLSVRHVRLTLSVSVYTSI